MMMTVRNPFQHILVSAQAEDRRPTETDHQAKDNPFKLDLIAACICENIKAGIAMVKEAIKQPFQLLADSFFPTVAILENLRNPFMINRMQTALISSAQKTSRGLSVPVYK
jgi:hypothetical protein